MSILTPVVGEGLVYSGNDRLGAAAVRIVIDGGVATVEEVYRGMKLPRMIGGAVLVGDYLYGTSGMALVSADFKTGEVKWSERASLPARSPTPTAGCTCMVKTARWPSSRRRPEAYREHGRFMPPNPPERRAQSRREGVGVPGHCRRPAVHPRRRRLWCYDIKDDAARELTSRGIGLHVERAMCRRCHTAAAGVSNQRRGADRPKAVSSVAWRMSRLAQPQHSAWREHDTSGVHSGALRRLGCAGTGQVCGGQLALASRAPGQRPDSPPDQKRDARRRLRCEEVPRRPDAGQEGEVQALSELTEAGPGQPARGAADSRRTGDRRDRRHLSEPSASGPLRRRREGAPAERYQDVRPGRRRQGKGGSGGIHQRRSPDRDARRSKASR